MPETYRCRCSQCKRQRSGYKLLSRSQHYRHALKEALLASELHTDNNPSLEEASADSEGFDDTTELAPLHEMKIQVGTISLATLNAKHIVF